MSLDEKYPISTTCWKFTTRTLYAYQHHPGYTRLILAKLLHNTVPAGVIYVRTEFLIAMLKLTNLPVERDAAVDTLASYFPCTAYLGIVTG
jgi:hypothetical protein